MPGVLYIQRLKNDERSRSWRFRGSPDWIMYGNYREPQMEMNQQQWLALKDRALAASAEGITIADARLPERPLIYVNEGENERSMQHLERFLELAPEDDEAATARELLSYIKESS